MLIVGRVVNGFCVGICSAQVPVYISEIAPPSKRGRVTSLQQWAITWGILIMYFICYGCSFLKGDASFRLPWGLQMIPAILLGLALFILPESPRWLAKKDRWEETHEVLTLVHGHGDPNSPFVARELAEIREVVEFERANSDVTYLELFKPKMINRTMIGLFMQIWSQLTGEFTLFSYSHAFRVHLADIPGPEIGMNVMMYYITYIFAMAGIGNGNLVSSGINYVINVLMTVPALIWLDHWGRRLPLLIGAFFMCLWLCVNAGLFAVYSRPALPGEFPSDAESMAISGPAAKAVIASTYLFVASYAPTWGPVSWTYPPELYPLRLRGKAVALATSGNWAFNFALAYFVPPAFKNITWQTYVVFAVFCFAMFWHVFFMFPETANKTLEEVSAIFDDTKPGAIPYIGTPAWKTRNARHETILKERNALGDEEKITAMARDVEHKD